MDKRRELKSIIEKNTKKLDYLEGIYLDALTVDSSLLDVAVSYCRAFIDYIDINSYFDKNDSTLYGYTSNRRDVADKYILFYRDDRLDVIKQYYNSLDINSKYNLWMKFINNNYTNSLVEFSQSLNDGELDIDRLITHLDCGFYDADDCSGVYIILKKV